MSAQARMIYTLYSRPESPDRWWIERAVGHATVGVDASYSWVSDCVTVAVVGEATNRADARGLLPPGLTLAATSEWASDRPAPSLVVFLHPGRCTKEVWFS